MSKRIKTALKISLSLALVAFVLSQIDLKTLLHLLKRSDPLWLFAAFILFNISKIIASVRLNLYFKDLGIFLKEWDALKLYYVGMFYNLFLPGGIGGDGYKVYLLQKHYKSGFKGLAAATILDRLSGLAALLVLCGILFYFSDYAHHYPVIGSWALACSFLVYPLFLFFHFKLFSRFTGYIWQTTFLGIVVQIFQLLSAYALLQALPQHAPLIDFLTLFLISSVVAVLPLTIGGVGAREATFLYGLKFLGYEPSLGVAFSFLFFLITLASSALGILSVHKPLPIVES